jgi:hypothetical protein
VAVDTPIHLKRLVKQKESVEVSVYRPPVDIEKHVCSVLRDVEVVKLISGNEEEGVLSRIKIIGESAEEQLGAVIDLLRQKQVRIGCVSVGVPTLEDVFIKLTGSNLSNGGTC